ncbi:glycosyltransferase family 2 protein [Polaribacter tangerinus]|uniref:glycosyltransferase family 2 protein n=1 Tax=Polaribacter tangerinus TaxID=1920034 RepID=UPI0029373722|nr:hypothetical protein [Polaribacter tangerinus]
MKPYFFTDADCKPASKFWISETAKYFNQNKTIVLGYGKYKRNKTLVNLFVRFETLLTAIQYFSYAKIGIPYMGVGRNLAYQKKEFYKVKGFASHLHIKSGDDDLFIQDAANKENTTLCIHPKSFTISNAPSSFKKWFRQKRRHISTANYYQNKHKILLANFFFTKIMIYIIGIFLAISYSFEFVSVSFCLYFGVQITVLTLVANKFKERGITFYIPLLEIGLLLFQFSIFITNFISKPTHWK